MDALYSAPSHTARVLVDASNPPARTCHNPSAGTLDCSCSLMCQNALFLAPLAQPECLSIHFFRLLVVALIRLAESDLDSPLVCRSGIPEILISVLFYIRKMSWPTQNRAGQNEE